MTNKTDRTTTQQAEDGIFSDNFGGLNTVTSDLNCPYTDSPLLVNCDIDTAGKVTKRLGTKLLKEEAKTGTLGYTLVPFTTGLLYTFLIEKLGTDLTVYEVNNDTITSVVSKSNVWNTAGASVRANYIKTSEYEPRVIFTTGVNQPVQLKFVEEQQIAGGVAANYAFTNATRFVNATTSNLIVYKNRVRVTPGSVVYGGTTLTLNGVSTVANDVIDIILVVWQHYVDALIYNGDRFCKQLTRFNVTSTDQNVLIPETIRDNAITTYDSETYRYHEIAYKSTAYNDKYTYVSNREPDTNVKYALGDGGRYVYAAGNKVNPSPYYFTFGALTGGSVIEQVVAIRRRVLTKLNGGQGITASKIKVLVDNVQKTQNTNNAAGSATYGDYYLWTSAGAISTSTSDTVYTLSFEGATVIGVPETSTIEIVNCSTSYIGSGASANIDGYADGTCFPCYGIGEFANYYTGSFPSNVSFYEGRLVFGGFSNDPLLTVFSEVGDKNKPGTNFASFQIDDLTTESDDPVAILLNSRPDDYITGLYLWQQSLFVFTRQAVFRIAGGTDGFTPTAKISIRVSDVGLVNGWSVAKSDKSLLYLSDIGVFDLFIGADSNSTEYVASEKTVKIRNLFGVTASINSQDLAWMVYDNASQKIYVGLPISQQGYTSHKLYVYSIFREAWTEYETPGGWNLYYLCSYTDRTLGQGLIGSVVTKRDGSSIPTNRMFLKFNYSKYLDFATTATGDGTTTAYTLAFDRRLFTATTVDKVYEYGTTVEQTSKHNAFQSIPISSLQDISVELETAAGSGNYNTLAFETDYVKRPNGKIYLIQNPGTGKTLRIRQRLPVTDSVEGEYTYNTLTSLPFHDSIVVWVDNVLQPYSSAYTTSISGTYQINFVVAPVNLSVIEYGRAYAAVYSSPLLTLQDLTTLKRMRFVYVYFDNQLGQETWAATDINTARTPDQDVEEIVGEPKQRMNASIAIAYESDLDNDIQYDLYGYENMVWDDSLFDIYPSASQFRRYVLFKESLAGVGYGYRLYVFSFDESAFSLAGYQITATQNAKRFINWSQ